MYLVQWEEKRVPRKSRPCPFGAYHVAGEGRDQSIKILLDRSFRDMNTLPMHVQHAEWFLWHFSSLFWRALLLQTRCRLLFTIHSVSTWFSCVTWLSCECEGGDREVENRKACHSSVTVLPGVGMGVSVWHRLNPWQTNGRQCSTDPKYVNYFVFSSSKLSFSCWNDWVAIGYVGERGKAS